MKYEEELKKLEAEKDYINNEIQRVKSEWISAESPVKEGDELIVNGYSNTGKKMIVRSVFIKDDYLDGYIFKARGSVLKKDGSIGLQSGDWYSNR